MSTVPSLRRSGQESFLPETGPRPDGRPPWKARCAADIWPRNPWLESRGCEMHRFLFQICRRRDSCGSSDNPDSVKRESPIKVRAWAAISTRVKMRGLARDPLPNQVLYLRAQPPLGAGVGDPESFTFGIALGIAAGDGYHHGQIASVIEGVAHAFMKERGLQTATAQLWNRRRTAKQRNIVMHTQNAGGAGLAVNFGEKAWALLACG